MCVLVCVLACVRAFVHCASVCVTEGGVKRKRQKEKEQVAVWWKE